VIKQYATYVDGGLKTALVGSAVWTILAGIAVRLYFTSHWGGVEEPEIGQPELGEHLGKNPKNCPRDGF
jgi:hypothetical protein